MPSPKIIPKICVGCGKQFFTRKNEIGTYCSKLCWGRAQNKTREHPDGPRRIRRIKPRTCPLDNSVKYPFAWATRYLKRNRRGRIRTSYYSAYGKARMRPIALPEEVIKALERISKLRKISISRLVSALCVTGILQGPHALQLKRARSIPSPETPLDQSYGWTDRDMRKLDEMCTADRLIHYPDQRETILSPHSAEEDRETRNQVPLDTGDS